MFTKQLLAYLPYLQQRKLFERGNVAKHGADARQMTFLLDSERLMRFAVQYLADRKVPVAIGA
jgi:hypothetical protein